ncbi:MAG: hypothetical protein HZB16_05465 [Armatimonadetes bacterium]|nr:hypothetical protein [Armatimonadota bacterium]
MSYKLLAKVVLGGYALGVVVETPVLLATLSPAHGWRRRCAAGLWLTACTYPLLVMVLPVFIDPDTAWTRYVVVGEVAVAVTESALFYLAFNRGTQRPRRWLVQDVVAVVLANLASYLVGRWVYGA